MVPALCVAGVCGYCAGHGVLCHGRGRWSLLPLSFFRFFAWVCAGGIRGRGLGNRLPAGGGVGTVRKVNSVRVRVCGVGVACAVMVVASCVAGGGPAAADSDAGFVLMKVSLGGRSVTPRWDPCSSVSVKVNVAALRPSRRAGARRDVKEALSRVGQAAGVRFVYRGSTAFVPSGSTSWASKAPAELVVAWTRPSGSKFRSSLLARGSAATGGPVVKSWGSSSASGRGFLVVNTGQDGLFRAGFGSGLSRGNMLMHELGHVLGLAHAPVGSGELMEPFISSGTRDGLGSGDRAGLWTVGRGSGCVSVPTWVFKPV